MTFSQLSMGPFWGHFWGKKGAFFGTFGVRNERICGFLIAFPLILDAFWGPDPVKKSAFMDF